HPPTVACNRLLGHTTSLLKPAQSPANVNQRVNRTTTRPGHPHVVTIRLSRQLAATKVRVAPREPIPRVCDHAASPCEPLATSACCDCPLASFDQTPAAGDGLSLVPQHVEVTRMIPYDKRTACCQR